MKRVVVLGRGGSGKSTFCHRLSASTGLPVIELDKVFWDESLKALTPEEWRGRQSKVAAEEKWIMDGDLGPFDVLEPRLTRADTVAIVEPPLTVCLWRALRRGRRRADFWLWVLSWRRTYRPRILEDIQRYASGVETVTLSSERDINNFLAVYSVGS